MYKIYAAKLKCYMNYQSRNYWAVFCEKAAKGIIFHIIKALDKRTCSESNFLLKDGTKEILGSTDAMLSLSNVDTLTVLIVSLIVQEPTA